MIKLIKTYWLPLVVLFVIFFDELFNSTAIVRGFTVESGMKQYEAILLAAIGYSMMGNDLLKGRIKKREHRTLVLLFAILFLYMLTSLFYGEASNNYKSGLLVYGSECIPAAYIGIRFAKSGSLHRINDILPYAVIPISLLIGTIGLAAALMGTTVGDSDYQEGGDTGLNYQTLSYYMAFSYTYAFYYVFWGNQKSGLKSIILRSAMAVDMLFCAVVCLMGGGRGAFVYMVAISFFMLMYYLKSSKKHRGHAILIISLLVIVSIYLIIRMGIMQSSGMERVTEHLTDDSTRQELFQLAFDAFLSSPIFGRGVGSIWWTVGFYSHNVVLDLLAETGLLGTLFLLNIVWRTIVKLYRLSKIDKIYMFLFLVMMGNVVNCIFSGYYIEAFKIYFVCSLVYCLPKNELSYNKLNIFYAKH